LFPIGPISSADRLIYPHGATAVAVVAIARRFGEAVEGLLYPMEIWFAGSHSLEGITVGWLLEDGLVGTPNPVWHRA